MGPLDVPGPVLGTGMARGPAFFPEDNKLKMLLDFYARVGNEAV